MLAGNAYGAIGDHEKAEAAYQRLIQVDPGNMDAYGKLAIMYHGQQRLDEAKAKYEEPRSTPGQARGRDDLAWDDI